MKWIKMLVLISVMTITLSSLLVGCSQENLTNNADENLELEQESEVTGPLIETDVTEEPVAEEIVPSETEVVDETETEAETEVTETEVTETPEVIYDTEPINNGDFDNGVEGWTTYFHFDAAGSFSVEDSEAVIYIERDGDEDYSVHMYQGQFTLDETKTYTLQFDARASVPHDLLIVLDNSAYDRHVNETVSLTTEMTTYTIDFTVPSEPVSLKLLVGELGDGVIGENEIVFDNISIYEDN